MAYGQLEAGAGRAVPGDRGTPDNRTDPEHHIDGCLSEMRKYLLFFIDVIEHKWRVFLECCRLGIPWLGITHDLSKFLPGEFIAYANYRYGSTAEIVAAQMIPVSYTHLTLPTTPYV